MPRYSKLIECSYCHKKFKHKKERRKSKYICSNYDRQSSNCVRVPVKEEQLDSLIEMRYRRKLSDEEIKEEIDSIEVSKEKIQINYKDGQEPTIIKTGYAQF